MDRILSGCAPTSKTSLAVCPDPSTIELPEGNDDEDDDDLVYSRGFVVYDAKGQSSNNQNI